VSHLTGPAGTQFDYDDQDVQLTIPAQWQLSAYPGSHIFHIPRQDLDFFATQVTGAHQAVQQELQLLQSELAKIRQRFPDDLLAIDTILQVIEQRLQAPGLPVPGTLSLANISPIPGAAG
jgi:hypothetical protein